MLILGHITARREQIGSGAFGACHVGTNGGSLGESEVPVFVEGQYDAIAVSGVSGVVGPGPIAFGLDCSEQGGGINYTQAHLTYVELSPG